MLLAQFQSSMGGIDLNVLQATGTITLTAGGTPYPITMAVSGSSFLRVNISNANRLTGFAAKGPLHKSYYADGTSAIDSFGTGVASISAFQLLRTTDVVSKLLSLSKDTGADNSGKQYDRLRARHAFGVFPSGKTPPHPQGAVVDYYFDPATHYLLRSITSIHVPGIVNAIPVETSYSDYRLVGLSRVPFHISQVLNGQPDWEITLTSVSFPTKLDPSLTSF